MSVASRAKCPVRNRGAKLVSINAAAQLLFTSCGEAARSISTSIGILRSYGRTQ